MTDNTRFVKTWINVVMIICQTKIVFSDTMTPLD